MIRVAVLAVCLGAVCAAADASPSTRQSEVDAWLASVARHHLAQRRKAIDEISTPAQIRERQEYIRSAIVRAVGRLPQVTAPLNPKITGTLQRSGYQVEKLIFESLPQFYVTANLY